MGLAHYCIPGERVTMFRAIGFLSGFAGVVILIGPESLLGLAEIDTTLLPMLAVLGGAVSYAVSAILARLRPYSDAFGTALATTMFATLMVVPFGLDDSRSILTLKSSGVELAAIAVLGVFSTATAAVVYFRLISRTGPAFVSQLNYLIPIWAVVVGAVFLGEQPQVNHLYALVMILGGILITQLQWTDMRRMSEGNERV